MKSVMTIVYLILSTGLCGFAGSADEPIAGKLTAGPMVGALESDGVRIWCRGSAEGQQIEVVLYDAAGKVVATGRQQTSSTRDFTCDLRLQAALLPGQQYRYKVLLDGEDVATAADQQVTGPPASDGQVGLVFGSCAQSKRYGEGDIWRSILGKNPQAMVFLGDTPYIDTTDLTRQRGAYRSFWTDPGLAAVIRQTSVLATWDDHDSGRNDSVGTIPGRENSRQAFDEYHALGPIGDGSSQGIYSSHRVGPVELFILDTRWFGKTEPSIFDSEKPTLLGKMQWEWLKQGMKDSTAPFKIVTCGMIFNGATRPGKTDHWGMYPYERQGLIDFIGENQISGVLVVTGDIHRCRHLSYPASEGAGYSLDEWITSPLANSVISSANAPHPALVFDGGEASVYLHVAADATSSDPTLNVRLIRGNDEVIHSKSYLLSEMMKTKIESTGQ